MNHLLPMPAAAGSADLPSVIGALGGADFASCLLGHLQAAGPVHTVTGIECDASGNARCLFVATRGRPAVLDRLPSYLAIAAHDPFVAWLRFAHSAAGLLKGDSSDALPEPYARFRSQSPTVVDRFATGLALGGSLIYCNVYRDRTFGTFGTEQLAALQSQAGLIGALVCKHADIVRGRPLDVATAAAVVSVADRLDAVAAASAARLSARERQVCCAILRGLLTEGIALELQIGETSVATYRKRAYDKLGIATRHELFSRCLAAPQPR